MLVAIPLAGSTAGVPRVPSRAHHGARREYAGIATEEANEAILANLEARLALFLPGEIVHRDGHCRRWEIPILCRTTVPWATEVEETMLSVGRLVTWTSHWAEGPRIRFGWRTRRTGPSRGCGSGAPLFRFGSVGKGTGCWPAANLQGAPG